MNFILHDSPLAYVPVAVILVLAWFAWDMRSILVSGQRKNRLSIEGRWKELEAHFKKSLKPYRPFVWLHQRYLLPGNLTTQFALYLYKQGRLEEALTQVDLAIRQIENKPEIFRSIHERETISTYRGALRSRTLILTGLGRYDEARQAAAKLGNAAGPEAGHNAALALLELQCGRLDEALAISQSVPPEDSQSDSMRAVTALALSTKGQFQEAIQALGYEPSDISKFYTREGMELVAGSSAGAKLLELQQKKVSGVFQPARLILLAQVYLACEDIDNAVQALDQAEKNLGAEPGIQAAYCRHRACSLAARGQASETEACLERLRAIVRQIPSRSLRWEMHYATGRCYLYLGRFNDALAEFNLAQQSALHPIEKHSTSYWIARSHEAAGQPREAAPYYQTVATSLIPSWMRQRAIGMPG